MTAPAAPSRQRSTGFAHRPGLDGLRGLAVAGVLAFHGGFAWAEGGYLGVSAFFTLSGFLIATLLLGEHRSTGHIDLRAFWIRRFRRLLPAALLGVLVAAVYAVVLADAVTLDRFPADALAAIGYVANWRFVWSELSYAELFSEASPLQHYWSLAIEEQFYLVLPLVAVGVLRRRRRASLLRTVALVGIVASVAASLVLDADRAYYGTDTRMAELLVGVLLAIWHHHRDLGRLDARARGVAGVVGIGAMVAMWSQVEQSSDALHPWLLLLHAGLTSAVIVAVLAPTRVERVLALPPLTALGRISYGVYVYHWPIFLWLSPERTGLGDGAVEDVALFALRLAATFAVAVPSHRFVEQPIRHHGLRLGRPQGPLLAAGAVAAVAAFAIVPARVIDRDPVIDFEAAESVQEELLDGTDTTSQPGSAGDDAPPPAPGRYADAAGPPPRVAVFGDSTALLFVPGLASWATTTGRIDLSGGFTELGCGLGRGGERDRLDVGVEPVPEICAFDVAWLEPLASAQPDIAVVEIGLWDVLGRRLPGDDAWRRVGDPVYDEYIRGEMRAATEVLLGTADRVVWVLQPVPVPSTRDPQDAVLEEMLLWNELIVDELGDHPQVGFVDLADWFEDAGEVDSVRLRPDGIHLTEGTSVEVAAWLAPAILLAADRTEVISGEDVESEPVA